MARTMEYIDPKLISIIEKKVLKDLTLEFNKKIETFFKESFDDKLEALVESKLNDIVNQSMSQSHQPETSQEEDNIKERLRVLEDLETGLVAKQAEIDLFLRTRSSEITDMKNEFTRFSTTINADLKQLSSSLHALQTNVDEELAIKLDSERVTPPYEDRIRLLEVLYQQLFTSQDNQEQYTRREILEFLNIPIQYRENTTNLIIEFCEYYLGVYINKYDISTSHRMIIPEDKKKYGSEYIPPIYCKFVNRSVVHQIMQSKHLLKHARNNLNQKFFIRENLTLHRRLLKEKVDNELHSFQFKWVKNGNIFVRKNKWSKPVKIASEEELRNLLQKQNNPGSVATNQCNSRLKSTANNVRKVTHTDSESNAPTANINVPYNRLGSSLSMSQPPESVNNNFCVNNSVNGSLSQPLSTSHLFTNQLFINSAVRTPNVV